MQETPPEHIEGIDPEKERLFLALSEFTSLKFKENNFPGLILSADIDHEFSDVYSIYCDASIAQIVGTISALIRMVKPKDRKMIRELIMKEWDPFQSPTLRADWVMKYQKQERREKLKEKIKTIVGAGLVFALLYGISVFVFSL